MTITSGHLSRTQRQVLGWIQTHQTVKRLSDNWWQPGESPEQTRRINHLTIEALVARGVLRYTLVLGKQGTAWPSAAEILNS